MEDLSFDAHAVERFESKVDRSGVCHLWLGGRTSKGYGNFLLRLYPKPVQIGAHRAAWLFAHGVGPGESHVLHTCDNPQCVRPDHLFLGTNEDNVADKVAKDRQSRGVQTNCVLNAQQVVEIRTIYALGAATQQEIAGQFGIGRRTVSDIVTGRSWKRLDAQSNVT